MKSKVLYIDDEEMNLEVFEFLFHNTHHVITTENPIEGFRILEKNDDLQVVITDMKMPEMNGLEFVTQAKRMFPTKKYFILSGFNEAAEIQGAIEKGLIDGSFSKPLDVEAITAEIG